ncbi:MAG: GNAT family N-acetyltransferase [Candidatus Thorarchaeota archaeon]|jgi:ribosomal protein S18 acetylase RimI-like enzyme
MSELHECLGRIMLEHALVNKFMVTQFQSQLRAVTTLWGIILKSTNSTTIPEIRELSSDESDEFVTLMELAFKDSIEEDRLDADEIRKIMKKIRTPVYKVLGRALKMRMEFYVAEVEDTIASGIQLNIEKDKVYVGNLMTHPKYQRQGLARKLLHLSFRRARELDVKKVRLDARADNINAVSLYTSEGFETTFHSGRFDSVIESTKSTSNDLIIREVNKIDFRDIDPMLDDCYPASHLEALGREKFLKNLIPSRVIRFFAGRLGGQSIHNYAIYVEGEENPRGIIEASQSRIEQRIRLSSPILFEKDNDLLLEFISKVLEIETGYRGLTIASITCSMHRTDAISRIESLGFKKMRESISMTKQL